MAPEAAEGGVMETRQLEFVAELLGEPYTILSDGNLYRGEDIRDGEHGWRDTHYYQAGGRSLPWWVVAGACLEKLAALGKWHQISDAVNRCHRLQCEGAAVNFPETIIECAADVQRYYPASPPGSAG
jgi:hypothetical protein